jgi:hypothetical protein
MELIRTKVEELERLLSSIESKVDGLSSKE